MDELLKILTEGGPTAFGVLVGALVETGHKNIAYELLEQEEAALVDDENAARVLFPIILCTGMRILLDHFCGPQFYFCSIIMFVSV